MWPESHGSCGGKWSAAVTALMNIRSIGCSVPEMLPTIERNQTATANTTSSATSTPSMYCQ